jgi:RNA polymerase-binding transcription factor DksA
MDILGVRRRLEIQLDELLARAGHIGADLLSPHSADSEEAAVEAESDEPLLGQSALLELEIAQVRAALSRLQDGNYGVCTSCGENIAPARLEAMPDAMQCIACAAPGMNG